MNIVRMDRNLDLSPWEIIAVVNEVELHTVTEISTIILTKGDGYFFLKDDIEKILDVSAMPLYIKEDWINYNKNLLNISTLNKFIEIFQDFVDDDVLPLLKSIRREMIINGVIN